jgi:hypothetical protein
MHCIFLAATEPMGSAIGTTPQLAQKLVPLFGPEKMSHGCVPYGVHVTGVYCWKFDRVPVSA